MTGPPRRSCKINVGPATASSPTSGGASAQPPLAPPTNHLTSAAPATATASLGDGNQSADVMARQIAAGVRAAGPLLGGLSGGTAEGLELTPPHRRVLHAQQLLHGIRAAGPLLVATPPPDYTLLPLSAYPPPLPGAGYSSAPYPGYVSPAWPASTPAASPYTTMQQPIPPAGGGAGAGGARSLYSTGQSAPPGPSDDLYIPYSTGMLGSFSPYRATALPVSLTCYECSAVRDHYGNECPLRFIRVRGEAPPGWQPGPNGGVQKDPAAWAGTELTSAARAKYRDFLAKFPLMAHISYPITVDEITGVSPPAPRHPLPRPSGGRRR